MLNIKVDFQTCEAEENVMMQFKALLSSGPIQTIGNKIKFFGNFLIITLAPASNIIFVYFLKNVCLQFMNITGPVNSARTESALSLGFRFVHFVSFVENIKEDVL